MGTLHSTAPNNAPDETSSTPGQEIVSKLQSELMRQRERLADIEMMGAIIASILEIERVLPVMMEMAIRTVGGEVGAILIEEEGELRPKISWGFGSDLIKSLHAEDGKNLIEAYLGGKDSFCLNNMNLAPGTGMTVNSLIAAAISSRERRHGLTIVMNKERNGTFLVEDLETLQSLNHFLAVAIENAQLLRDTLEKQRMDQEMQIAKQIQETILPSTNFSHPGFTIGSVYKAYHEVGGDFYDLIPLPGDDFVLVVGDVSSKGVPAALVMSACSGIIKSLLKTLPNISMADLAINLNDTLVEGVIKDKGMFATIWFGRFDSNGKSLTYCNAGHVPPLFHSASDGGIEELAIGGPLIGQFEGIPFKQTTVELSKGDSVTVCTDGLTEAASESGELFGREGARRFVLEQSGRSPQEFCNHLKNTIDIYTKDSALDTKDDFTVLQVRVGEVSP